MSERRYEDVIEFSTEALERLMKSHILQLLDLRSTAYEKQGLLSRALEDAARMTQYVPTSPLGYLKVGSIQWINGKSGLAADNLKEGLKLVPKSHSQYHQMQEEFAKAMLRAQSRFDIIANLPREVVHKIMLLLKESERLWVCVTVSQKWCDQVTHCASWWNSVTIKETGTSLDQLISDAIPRVKKCIEYLELPDLSSFDLRKRYFAHLKNGGFANIKMLSLKETIYRIMEPEDFAITLWQMRHTLTSLKLELRANKPYRLLSVLATCPNIEDLSYVTAGDILFTNENKSYATVVTCEKLLNMELHYQGSNTTYSAICSHIALCPNIRRLILKSFNETPFVGNARTTTFTDYCPKLKVLGLNCAEETPDVDNLAECSTYQKGLRCICVKFDHVGNFHHTLRHIEAQYYSLEQLVVVHTQVNEQHQIQAPPVGSTSLHTYSKLHTLRYIYHNAGYYNYSQHGAHAASTAESILGAIIQNSPNLSNLSLLCPFIPMHLRIIVEQTIKNRIQNLTLDSVTFQSATTDWFRSLFSTLRRVQNLIIQNCSFFDDDIMLSLAASESVRHLTITKCSRISSDGLTEFLKKVALCHSHRLQTLNLNSLSTPLTASAVGAIVKVKSLFTLRISGDKSISVETINNLIDQAPGSSLKRIEILNCSSPRTATTWQDSISRLKMNGIALVIL
ncbi:hypothetical protein BJV82DRAFT_712360 [Fennellomyces sp. T-0311]|nr:hypothetical protein BJV82DRAFT_712360 [Fennellomyces sp. T-0311]